MLPNVAYYAIHSHLLLHIILVLCMKFIIQHEIHQSSQF